MRFIPSIVAVCSLVICFAIPTLAQDEARAAWQITKFDITVAAPGTERTLSAQATLSARNVGGGAGSTLSLRINSKAEVKSVTVGSATATFTSRPETRGNVTTQRFTINLPSSVPSGGNVTVTVDYKLPIADNTGVAAISSIGSQFLPQSMWYPMANNAFAVRGADYAPFRLTINGGGATSSGVDKSAGGNSIFEQSLNGQPFFVVGSWDRVDGGSNASGIVAFIPKGAGADERTQAEALINLASEARSFYATMLGTAPDAPVRLISVIRGAGFADAGAILLGEGAFRRKKIDSTTALTISEAIARLWIGGATPVRGEGNGVVREGLTRFMATLFIEKKFGAPAAEAERARQRIAYAAIARRDGPLSRTTPLDPTYFNTVGNKGAMVWRLIDHLIGHETFASVIRNSIADAKTNPEGLSLARVRAALSDRGGAALRAILDPEFDQVTDTDLLAGLPHQENGQWMAALRNLGSLNATVNVAGWTAAGQQVIAQTNIPAHDFGQVVFKNTSGITRVEVDPEKFYPQIDYANDVAPAVPEIAVSLAEANRLYGAQDFAKSEVLARQMLAASPRFQEARIVLGRALLAQNKNDEAEKEFKQLLADPLPLPSALSWAGIGLGEIAMRRGQASEAARYLNEVIRGESDFSDYAASLAARAARLRAESSTAPADETAKAFINQLDAAIRTGRQAAIGPLIMPGELTRFVQQLVGTQPEAWQTRVLRTEQLDANRIAVDVALNSRQLGVDHSGTAVFVLAKVGSGWKLNAIELFEVN
jgi:tetratricopeptide (TPR) repeat protein